MIFEEFFREIKVENNEAVQNRFIFTNFWRIFREIKVENRLFFRFVVCFKVLSGLKWDFFVDIQTLWVF